MLIELSYVFLSFLLMGYAVWRYFKQRERGLFYLTLGFTFLALSATFQMLNSQTWIYEILKYSIIMLRLLELGGLAFFACFIICTIIALRKIFAKTSNSQSTRS